ncbi:MAG: hypothetical protein JXB13_20835 [Phycisphaerae bacterium]|nr:hypothetical protein [Phycisphaerae bacterium]
MTRLLARLLLAFAVVLAAPVFCTALVIVLVEGSSYRMFTLWLSVAQGITALLFIVAWIAVWRGQVVWSRWRRSLTYASVLWSLGVGSTLGLGMAAITNEEEVGIVFAGLFWFVTWIPSTALVWRETARERAARLKTIVVGTVNCPNCGYNMTGLHEARCPECGTQYTLNELFAALQETTGDLEPQATPVSDQ